MQFNKSITSVGLEVGKLVRPTDVDGSPLPPTMDPGGDRMCLGLDNSSVFLHGSREAFVQFIKTLQNAVDTGKWVDTTPKPVVVEE